MTATSDGLLSLREAVAQANAAAGADEIVFADELAGATLRLTQGQLAVTDALTVTGATGASGKPTLTLDAGGNGHVFDVQSTQATLHGLVLTGGDVTGDGGGGVRVVDGRLDLDHVAVIGNNVEDASGGGVLAVNSTGSVVATTIADNFVASSGGGMHIQEGKWLILDSTFENNSARTGRGGGLYLGGKAPEAQIANSTFAENSAALLGGGIAHWGEEPGRVMLVNVTIVDNFAAEVGAGLFAASEIQIANTIVYRNSTDRGGDDVHGNYDEIGPNLISDLIRMGGIDDNGGTVRTAALDPAAHNAVDQGTDAFIDRVELLPGYADSDARGAGFARLIGPHVDIGAFEVQRLSELPPLFTAGDDLVDLRRVDLDLYPARSASHALGGDDRVHLSATQFAGVPFNAGAGSDQIRGSWADDRIRGGAGDDRMWGNRGDDRLFGGAGDDRLHAGPGSDLLWGGTGADRFVFGEPAVAREGSGAAHRILDFSHRDGDRIGFANIDADPGRPGDQSLGYIGTDTFSAAGQVRFEVVGNRTLVEVNLDHDRDAELVVTLHDAPLLRAHDFLL